MPEHFTAQSTPPSISYRRNVQLIPEFPSAPVLTSRPRPSVPPTLSSNLAHSSPPPKSSDREREYDRERQRQRDRDPQRNPDRQRNPDSEHAFKKPRTWSAMFKRRPTALAAAAAADSARVSAHAPGVIQTQTEFRRNFLKVNKERIIRDEQGNFFRLHPIVMNGDCGFGAIAKGINCARAHVRNLNPPASEDSARRAASRVGAEKKARSRRRRLRDFVWGSSSKRGLVDRNGKTLQAKDIRKAMYDELRKARKTYLRDCEEFKGIFTDDDFDRLEREVSQPGIAGHWLGAVLGLLEHVIVAHAMNITIFLYQFDLQKQCIRRFESAIVENPDCEVYLFFTGPAACGHFDTLVKITEPKTHIFAA